MNFLHDMQWVLPLRSPVFTTLAFGLSWLGYTTFIMFFLAIGYWTANKTIFFRLLVLVVINTLINGLIKDWFQDPRPPMELRLDNMVGTSYGLPSGHTQMAVVLWLWLAWEIRRAWVWALCIAIVVGVSTSRLYLGVHDVEDVLVGAALGGVSLLVFGKMIARTKLRTWPVYASIAAIAILTAAAMAAWPNGQAPDHVPMLAAWLVTAICCLQYDISHMQFSSATHLARKCAAGLIGGLGLIGEQKLLKLLTLAWPMNTTLAALLNGLAGGLFVSLCVPWLLIRLRLAQRGLPHRE